MLTTPTATEKPSLCRHRILPPLPFALCPSNPVVESQAKSLVLKEHRPVKMQIPLEGVHPQPSQYPLSTRLPTTRTSPAHLAGSVETLLALPCPAPSTNLTWKMECAVESVRLVSHQCSSRLHPETRLPHHQPLPPLSVPPTFRPTSPNSLVEFRSLVDLTSTLHVLTKPAVKMPCQPLRLLLLASTTAMSSSSWDIRPELGIRQGRGREGTRFPWLQTHLPRQRQ